MSKKRRLVEIIAETRNISKIRKSMQYITAMQDEIIEALAAGWKLNDIYITLHDKYNYEYTYNIFISSLKRIGIDYNNINLAEVDNQVVETIINQVENNDYNTPNINNNQTETESKIESEIIEKKEEKKKPKIFTVEHKKFEYSNEKK